MTVTLLEMREFHDRLCRLRHPEELFGDLGGSADEGARTIERMHADFMVSYDPSLYSGRGAVEQYLSREIVNALSALRAEGLSRVRQGTYGRSDPAARHAGSSVIKTAQAEYRVLTRLATGTIADVYLAEYDEPGGAVEQVCIKVARDRADTDLMRNEQRSLRQFSHKSLPALVEAFVASDGQAATVLRYIEGGHDLITIRENPRYAGGVPQEHLCWILERQLSVLGYLHSQKLIHGNIEPGNVMVRPRDHNVFLIDFVFSVLDPVATDYIKCATEHYSAPEVSQKKPPLPTADIYSLGKCAVYLLGGDPDSGRLPDAVDPRLAEFLRHFILPDFRLRARDAWELHGELVRLRQAIFGPRRFLDFPM